MMLHDLKSTKDGYIWTSQAKNELLKCINNKQHFIETYIKIQTPHEHSAPMVLTKSQEKALNEHSNQLKTMCAAYRQSGMTTLFAAEIVHTLVFKPHSSIIYFTYNGLAAKSFLELVARMIKSLPKCFQGTSNMDKSFISMDNGSRVIAGSVLSEFSKTFSPSHFYFDNIGISSVGQLKRFLRQLYPLFTIKHFTLRMVDAPIHDYFSKLEPFLEIEGMHKFSLSILDDPKFDSSYKKEIIDSIGLEKFRQEYQPHWTFA